MDWILRLLAILKPSANQLVAPAYENFANS